MQIVRVFISSTFLDFTLERNILHENVFPRVRELCKKHNCEFQAIDLRWGITEKDCEDYSTLDICLEELKQCQRVTPRPNFLFLSGNRYGWRPLPRVIPNALFRSLFDILSADKQKALQEAYRQDDNAAGHDYVFTQLPEGYSEEALHQILRDAADAIENKKSGVFRKSEKLSQDSHHILFASATHHELLERLALPDFEGAAICAVRTLKNVPQKDISMYYDTLPDGSVDKNAYQETIRIGKTVEELCPNTYRYELDLTAAKNDPAGELSGFADYIYEKMEKHILSELEKNKDDTELTDEINYHQAKLNELTRYYQGRVDELAKAVGSVLSDDNNVLVITGGTSCGKSAFTAKVAELVRESGKKVYYRVVGLTGNSADINKLTEDLNKERSADNASGCVIVLDGVDKAYNASAFLRGVLKMADHDVRIVLSMRQAFADNIKEYLSGCDILTLDTMHIPDINQITDGFLRASGRDLTLPQKRCLTRAFQLSENMHVYSFLLKSALRWHSFDSVPMTDDEIRELITSVGKSNANLPEKLTRNMRLYLAAARDGLSSAELLGALSCDREVLEEFFRSTMHIPPAFKQIIKGFADKNGLVKADNETLTDLLHHTEQLSELLDELTSSQKEMLLPYAYFSRALYDLMPALGEALSQGQRVYVIEQGLPLDLPSSDSEQLKEFHSRLADYFAKVDSGLAGRMMLTLLTAFGMTENSRKARELPYQYLKAERYDDLYRFLCDEQWLVFLYRWNRAELRYLWNKLESTGRYSAVEGYAGLINEARQIVDGTHPSPVQSKRQPFEALASLLTAQGGHQKETALLSDAQILLIADDGDDSHLQSRARKALIMMEEDKFAEALAYLEELLKTAQLRDTVGCCDLLYAYGVALYRNERYHEANDVFEQSLVIAKSIGNKSREENLLKWLGSCAKVTGNAEKAERIYAELEEKAEMNEDYETLIALNYERATGVFLFEHDFERAFTLIGKARALAEERGMRVWLLKILEITMFMHQPLRHHEDIIQLSLRYMEVWSEVNPGQKMSDHLLLIYLMSKMIVSKETDKLYLCESIFLTESCGFFSEDDPIIIGHRDSGLLRLVYRKCVSLLPDELKKIIAGIKPDPQSFVDFYEKGIEKYLNRFDENGKARFWEFQTKCEAAASKKLGGEPLGEITHRDTAYNEASMLEMRISFSFLFLYLGFDPVNRFTSSTEDQRDMLHAHAIAFSDAAGMLKAKTSYNEYKARLDLFQEEKRLYKEKKKEIEKKLEDEPEFIRSLMNQFDDQDEE